MHVVKDHISHRLLTTVPHPPSVIPRLPTTAPSGTQAKPATAVPVSVAAAPTRPVVVFSPPKQNFVVNTSTVSTQASSTASASASQRVVQTQAVVAPSYTTSNQTKTGSAAAYATGYRRSYTGLVHSYAG